MNNVRTTLALVALSLLFSSAPLVAQEGTVGENFEAAGTAFGVSGSYYNDLDGYWSFYVRPSFDFYLMDGLALSASARYYTRSDYPDEISLSTGLSYTIPFAPDRPSGAALQLGAYPYLSFTPETEFLYFSIMPNLRLYYFLTPRFAQHISLYGVRLWAWNQPWDSASGTGTWLEVAVGFSYYVPTRDRVLGSGDGYTEPARAEEELAVTVTVEQTEPAAASFSQARARLETVEPIQLESGATYRGETTNGIPDGIGILTEGANSVTGTFKDGALNGPAELVYADGATMSGWFRDGNPEGTFLLSSDGVTRGAEYLNGERLSAELTAKTLQVLNEIEMLKARVNRILTETRSLEDVEDLLYEIADKRVALQQDYEPDRRLAEFSFGEKTAVVRTRNGNTVQVDLFEEDVITGPDGNVVKITRTTVSGMFQKGSMGVQVTGETVERNTEPVYHVSTLTGSIGGTASFGYATSVVATAGLGYRYFTNRGNPFPDVEGGKGNGLDLRIGVNGGVGSGAAQAGAQATLGWTWFKFDPMDPATLLQHGRGWTLGLGVMYAAVFTEFGTLGMPVPLPLIAWERYRYNPQTAKYRSWTIGGFLWPVPFIVSLNVGFSL